MFMFPVGIPVGGGAHGSSWIGPLATTRWAIIMSWMSRGSHLSVGEASADVWLDWVVALVFQRGLLGTSILGASLSVRVFGGILRYKDL